MIMMIRRHIRSIAGGAANVAPAVLCVLCVLSILCVASGCHRRPLEDPSEKTLVKVKVNVKDIHELKALAERISGVPGKPAHGERTVAKVIYRDGTPLDEIKNVPAME